MSQRKCAKGVDPSSVLRPLYRLKLRARLLLSNLLYHLSRYERHIIEMCEANLPVVPLRLDCAIANLDHCASHGIRSHRLPYQSISDLNLGSMFSCHARIISNRLFRSGSKLRLSLGPSLVENKSLTHFSD